MPSHPLPRSILNLSWSNLAAQSAEQLSLAAAPLVAVLSLAAGTAQIGILTALQTLPFLLLSMPLGVLADRLPGRRLMVWSEGLRLLALLATFALLLSSGLTIAGLAALGFIGAVGTVGFSVTAPALVLSLAPRQALGRANARLELARSMAFAAGPAVAGVLVSWVGASAAYALGTALSATAMYFLLQRAAPGSAAPHAPRRRARRQHALRDVAEGAAFVWRDALLRPIMITGVIFNIAWFVLQVVYVPYAVHALGLNAGEVGGTMALYGVGMCIGALLTPRILARLPLGRAIQIGPVCGALGAASLATTLLIPSVWLAGLCFFLLGAGPIVWTIATTTLRQNVTPDALLGRVSALFLTVNTGARPIGAALGGLIGAHWGEPACLMIALAGFAVQALVITCSGAAALRQMPVSAA
ncbi:MFS transporter [Bordetella sp. FB-8]|uniref:MFS transporter n=1 Tax=Bordetella sp. FB-8 TaxID=1159870 RepID=UPI00036F6C91|nr:MFS transporter [Bordetella sp. FB-8]